MKKALLSIILLASACIFAHSQETDSLNMMFLELPESMVAGERPVARMEQGRLSYDLPLLLEKIPADNAFDALTKIPGVYAQNDDISFAGRPVTLIIDGKVTTMDYGQLAERLKAMPSERLAKAEVMLSAPPRYHVRGAVINVITKDYRGPGHFSGQLQGTYTQSRFGTGHAKGNLLYAGDRLSFDAGYSFTYEKAYGQAEHKAKHPLNGNIIDYYDVISNVNLGQAHIYRAGMDYRLGDNHNISLAYNGRYSAFDAENTTGGTGASIQKSEGRTVLHNADLNYALPFGLSLSASYIRWQSPKRQHLDGTLEQETKNLTADSDQVIDKFLFAADQQHGFGKGWTLSYGAKAQFARNCSWQTTCDAAGEIMPEGTSRVDIDERILNGYAGFGWQHGQTLSLDMSVAVENYHSHKWNDWRVYPTMNLMWNVNDSNMLNLSFDSNANYPSYWSTMSSVHYTSAYTEIWGNPDLKPSSAYNLSLMWQFRRKYTLVAFAGLNPDFYVQLPYQPSDRMAVIMKEVNFDWRRNFGLQAMAQFSAGQWLNGNAFLAASYTNDRCGDFFDLAFDRHKVTFIAGGNASARLSRKVNIVFVLNPFFQSDAIQGVFDISSIFLLNASLRWTSGNGRWNMALSGNNLTNSKFRTKSVYGGQNFEMNVNQNWINASLSCIYRFGNYKEKRTRTADTSRMGY